MINRRNYYRILHVQPDAPIEIIRASYRVLMQTLKMHPDLGGDHWNATLINEAYEILSDEFTRREYDKTLLKKYFSESEGNKSIHDYCQFCKTPHERIPEYNLKKLKYACVECQSPLEKLDLTQEDKQRHLPRYEKKELILFYVYWPEPYFTGEIEDISPAGMRFKMQTEVLLYPNQIIKLSNKTIQAIAKVRYIKMEGDVGVEFLTVSFEHNQGNFINEII